MKRIALLFAVVGFGLVGCQNHYYEDPDHRDTRKSEALSSRVEENGKLNALEVKEIRAQVKDNVLRVQVEVFNHRAGDEQLYYRFRWLNDDGMTVWEEEAWKPLVVYGKQTKVIAVNAPTFEATDFVFEVQGPNNSTIKHHYPRSTADNPPYR